MTDEVSWEDLLPCPFCGGAGELRHPVSDMAGTYVFCTNCLAKSARYINPEVARKQWNARHASPLRTRIAEIEGAAVAFLAKLNECQPHIDDAFFHRQLRCGAYDGPQYGEELAALRATLNGEKKHG